MKYMCSLDNGVAREISADTLLSTYAGLQAYWLGTIFKKHVVTTDGGTLVIQEVEEDHARIYP